uniref:Predicted protein n=1 Tax=Physcomitrium patens TaxID=3218 RepID=A9TUZ5_PHYPA
METCQISEAKMISSLHLAIEPKFQEKMKELLEGDVIFILLEDESTESDYTNNWKKLKEVVVVLGRQQEAKAKEVSIWPKKSSTLASMSSLSMQGTNLKKREMKEQGGEGEKKDSFQTITMEGQGIQKFEGNAKIKDLETNDNAVGSYGYSILNKFIQVDNGNLDEKSLSDKKKFSIFEGDEDVLPNTLDYVEEFKIESLQKIDYGSIEDYNHEDCMNSQYCDVRSGRIMHRYDDENQITYDYETTYELGERSYEFLHEEGYEIV